MPTPLRGVRFRLPAQGRGRACQRVVVVVGLVDGPTTKGLPVELLPVLVEPGPPIELVLPEPLLPGMPLVLLLEVDVSGAGLVVVVDELDELVGVPD